MTKLKKISKKKNQKIPETSINTVSISASIEKKYHLSEWKNWKIRTSEKDEWQMENRKNNHRQQTKDDHDKGT